MWRRLIRDKYEKEAEKFLSSNGSSYSKSWMWRDISRLLDPRFASSDPFVMHLVFQGVGLMEEWIAPPVGSVKFNTNRAVRGSFGKASIGGILSDNSGKVLLKFSKSIGVADSTSAELLAIKEALVVFMSTGLVETFHLQVESDCSNDVSWLCYPSTTPITFKELVYECLAMSSNLNWELILVDRKKNKWVARLAKAGIGGDLISVCDRDIDGLLVAGLLLGGVFHSRTLKMNVRVQLPCGNVGSR
ncbi:hypothetical protein V6N11_034450 [Hibiscus sabdariffa]|uniref:RNase H type-1 domain-containing protein n=1 Tax=Hibiscus sabdariffa TaxID=183260 RepID=A0ABR2NMM8_9ROSI